MKSKELKRIEKFVDEIQTENYKIKQREIQNPEHIDIDKYIEIKFIPSQKDKEELKYFNTKHIGIIFIVSFCTLFFGNRYLLNIGLWTLITTIYVFLHLWFYKSKKNPMIKKMYEKCCICGSRTIHTPIYDSDDIELFFCIECKKYVRYFHIWNRS